ncbi:pyridoxamine kinase [Lacticaseibacillus hulanensis]|uniref:pyridoxamine kinase n=1 Tax=Lacticaseibacillus hulanensis TaxID=2493111 RepID=UPI000FDA573A|nr:pyridoxamine kinase [Lacticaseibacillus hulanensis]
MAHTIVNQPQRPLPRLIISQDLSGVGQVSMGVALPIVATLNVEPAILPTALLSAHTAFPGSTFTDLSASMPATLAHWQALGLNPAGVYLGYLGSAALNVWRKWLPQFAASSVCLVDPVMGDGGKLYRGFDDAYVTGMRALAQQATIITPNITESALLLDQPLPQGPIQLATLRAMTTALASKFNAAVVLTGVPLPEGDLGTAGLTTTDAEPFILRQPRLPGTYFGTGDIFASVLAAGLVRGLQLRPLCTAAMDFIDGAIKRTLMAGTDPRFGVQYAAGLPALQQFFTDKEATNDGPQL